MVGEYMIKWNIIYENYKNKPKFHSFLNRKPKAGDFPAVKTAFLETSLGGSYTLEAAIVMSMVLFIVSSLIVTSYRWRNQTVGSIKLQEMVEYLRYTEEDALPEGERLDMAAPTFHLIAQYTGGYVVGEGKGERWNLTIESNRFNPEEFLRMISMIVQ